MPTLTYGIHRDDHEKEIALKKLRERQIQQQDAQPAEPSQKHPKFNLKRIIITILKICIITISAFGIYLRTKDVIWAVLVYLFGLLFYYIMKDVAYKRKFRNYVEKNSTQYKDLLALNNEMNEKHIKIYVQPNTCHYEIANGTIFIKAYHKCRSKKQFDQINTTKLAQDYIYRDHDLFNESMKVKDIETNLAIQYDTRINEIRNQSDYDQLPERYKEDITSEEYKKYIQKLIQANLISFAIDIKFILVYSYTSPQGRNHYSDYVIFYEDEIWDYMKKQQSNSKTPNSQSLYGTAGVSEAFKQRQRSLMTNKMRYKILQRDNHRCVLCGRTAQESIAASGHGLEVDHITPVSKGGKTEESNLRTLCFACNRGKGADIEKNTA